MPLSRGNLVSQYDIFFFQTLYYHKLRLGRTGNAIADCFHSFFEFSKTFTQMDCAVPRKYKICKTTLHENHRFAFGSAYRKLVYSRNYQRLIVLVQTDRTVFVLSTSDWCTHRWEKSDVFTSTTNL